MHLIPCYQSADYVYDDSLELYYISFTSRALGGVDICALLDSGFQRDTRRDDLLFFEQLLKLNPESELPVYDPSVKLYSQYHEDRFRRYHERSARLHLENMSYISLLLAPFLDDWTPSTSGDPVRFRAFLQFVEENLSRNLSVEGIAEHLGLAPNYLSDWLAKHYGFRPVEYITRRRVEEAQMQLIVSRKSIKEIAYGLGFSSVSYFIRVFRERTGTTPARYRNLYM